MTDKEKEKLLKKFDKFLDFMQDIEWSDAFLIGNYGWSSSGYLDVSVPLVRFLSLCIQLKIPNLS